MPPASKVVDVHTHHYPPSYISLLSSRTTIPYILPSDSPSTPDRLVILPAEDASPSISRGRPIGPEYHSIESKIAFMDRHGIDMSVISLANPWLDWLPSLTAAATARQVNDDFNAVCRAHPGRLYAFGTLPLSAPVVDIVAEVKRLKGMDWMRGVIIGTTGLGKGLDDPDMNPIWDALEETEQVVFLHPHYGLPADLFGPRQGEYGHVLPLALGFPLETTIAVTRMLLSGVWDRHKELKVLIAHSGGTLPFLAGRIESCIEHDSHLKGKDKTQQRRKVWEILKQNIYLDAVIYADVGLKAAIDASGADRLLFGTDHPFFPPLDNEDDKWLSVQSNSSAITSAVGDITRDREAIIGGNAVKILRLT